MNLINLKELGIDERAQRVAYLEAQHLTMDPFLFGKNQKCFDKSDDDFVLTVLMSLTLRQGKLFSSFTNTNQAEPTVNQTS